MITKISSHEVPDLFYVNADYAPEWIEQGFLEPLDDECVAHAVAPPWRRRRSRAISQSVKRASGIVIATNSTAAER